MDIDSTIEEIMRDAADEASNIAVGEAIMGTDEEAAKVAPEEAAKDAAEEGGNNSVEATGDISILGVPSADSAMRAILTGKVAMDDNPSTPEEPFSSKYLKVGDDLFISLTGTSSIGAPVEGEALDDEIITAAGVEVIDEPHTNNSKTKE
jgi:hypothetical protein